MKAVHNIWRPKKRRRHLFWTFCKQKGHIRPASQSGHPSQRIHTCHISHDDTWCMFEHLLHSSSSLKDYLMDLMIDAFSCSEFPMATLFVPDPSKKSSRTAPRLAAGKLLTQLASSSCKLFKSLGRSSAAANVSCNSLSHRKDACWKCPASVKSHGTSNPHHPPRVGMIRKNLPYICHGFWWHMTRAMAQSPSLSLPFGTSIGDYWIFLGYLLMVNLVNSSQIRKEQVGVGHLRPALCRRRG